MKRTGIHMISMLLFVVIALAAFNVPALAASEKTVYVATRVGTVRKSASMRSKQVAELGFGTEVTELSRDVNYTKVRYANNKTGYMESTELTTKNPNGSGRAVYIQAKTQNVYSYADGSAKKLGTLKRNQKVTAVGQMFDWLRIEYKGGYGYVRASYTDEARYDASAGKNAWCAATKAYVRVLAAKDDDKNATNDTIRTIFLGQKCTLLGTVKDGKFAKLRDSKGRIGYVEASAISKENPNQMNQTAYLLYGGAALYKEIYTSDIPAKSGTKLSKGTKVTVVAVNKDGLWARVKYKGKYSYMPRVLLSADKKATTQKLVTRTSTSLYKDKRYSADHTDLKAGAKLTMTGMGERGVWLKVTTENGASGYVRIEDVKLG